MQGNLLISHKLYHEYLFVLELCGHVHAQLAHHGLNASLGFACSCRVIDTYPVIELWGDVVSYLAAVSLHELVSVSLSGKD